MDGIRRKVTKREMGLFWFIYLGEFGSVLWFCAYVYCFGLVLDCYKEGEGVLGRNRY